MGQSANFYLLEKKLLVLSFSLLLAFPELKNPPFPKSFFPFRFFLFLSFLTANYSPAVTHSGRSTFHGLNLTGMFFPFILFIQSLKVKKSFTNRLTVQSSCPLLEFLSVRRNLDDPKLSFAFRGWRIGLFNEIVIHVITSKVQRSVLRRNGWRDSRRRSHRDS